MTVSRVDIQHGMAAHLRTLQICCVVVFICVLRCGVLFCVVLLFYCVLLGTGVFCLVCSVLLVGALQCVRDVPMEGMVTSAAIWFSARSMIRSRESGQGQ